MRHVIKIIMVSIKMQSLAGKNAYFHACSSRWGRDRGRLVGYMNTDNMTKEAQTDSRGEKVVVVSYEKL